MAEPTMTTTAAPATGAVKTGGNGKPDETSSLTVEKALEGKKSVTDLLKAAVDLEEAANANPEPELEPETEPAKEPDAEPVVDDETWQGQADNGHVIIRPTRFNKLMEAKGRAEVLQNTLDNMMAMLKSKAETVQTTDGNGATTEKATDATFQQKLDAVKAKIKAASENFDSQALSDATVELTEMLVQEKTAVTEKNMDAKSEQNEWVKRLEKAGVDHNAVRDTQFVEDKKRFPDLNDKTSPIYRMTSQQIAQWQQARDPISLAPDMERQALELAARRLGVTPVAVETQTTSAPVKPVQPKNTQTLRRTTAITAGNNAGGKPMPTAEDYEKQISAIKNPREIRNLLDVLAEQIESAKPTRRR